MTLVEKIAEILKGHDAYKPFHAELLLEVYEEWQREERRGNE